MLFFGCHDFYKKMPIFGKPYYNAKQTILPNPFVKRLKDFIE